MSEAQRVLVIEDEPDMIRGLRDAMTFEGFDVATAATGQEGVESARRGHPNLILLDLMLPDINGYRVCEEIRTFDPRVPIIMLTARGQEADKIRGFEAGADDYVTKPFSVNELLARIHAMFRRMALTPAKAGEVLEIGSSRIDLRAQELLRHRRRQPLSFYEVEVLRLLADRPNEVVLRDEILEKIWGLETTHSNRTVDNVVVKLRKKLEDDSRSPRHILTIYGQGYKLVH
ncbi:MAG: response regulator transcription factor [Deltaproteobacteria bacterium]|nr:response regulator transcription factor [Deltaproteobacteria bacterium]